MSQQARDDSGRFARSHDPDEVLSEMDLIEPYSTGELADRVGWPQRTTYNVLDDLTEEGKIRKKKTDPRRVVWIRVGDGETV